MCILVRIFEIVNLAQYVLIRHSGGRTIFFTIQKPAIKEIVKSGSDESAKSDGIKDEHEPVD